MIMFYATMLLLFPNVLVITYIFDIAEYVNIMRFMFWLLMAVVFLTGLGTGLLFYYRDKLKRRVKPTYRAEFIYLLFLSAFGLLGVNVLYDYFGGDPQYVANVLIFVFAVMLYVLITLGRIYFKFNYMRKR